ncbi:GATA zinc finger domain-containing protein 14-like [Diaphorina citri]|uniref:GATA zinc finger domain-containing protein 14-like n=1 Tax=Diaphorina citri TaxID=121845 RepID=A0A3Q0IMD5_DIACI|nr:GATA zinc finger domain-containing protein 14-like [Diaphorina citri]
MNYANTWLYGTVSLKPQCRPGLMICAAEASGPGPGPPSFAIVMCNCPEFLIGTTRSKKSLCKKCGGARTTNWNMDEFGNQSAPGIHNNLSRRYNTVRINRPITGFNMELDPYMLMRKSRFKTEKNDQLVSKNSNANRKSILECHVNPYDLIKFNKYYDTGQQAEDKKLRDNTGCKINKILDNTESVNTSSGSKKINKLLNKFKFKSSSNTPVPTSNISIAGHRININNKGDRAPVKISEEFVKDSSESEDFDEPEVDYSDHEFEHNTEGEHPNQKSKQSSEQTNKDMKNTHNDSISLRHHQTNKTTSDYSTRNKEYKSQSFNHYTDHNIFSQRKHSIPEIPRYQNKSNSNAVSRNHESNDSKHFEQSRNLASTKVNDQVAINKEVNISNETNNNIENRLRNFKINESIISRHYDGNKRHSFDPYKMSELQKMMTHGEPNKRHSVCEAPSLAFLENSANDHESRSVNSQADNHNVGHLIRSNSQISTNSSHKSIHQDSDDGEDKVDLLETEIKPIPRISVRPVSNKFNTNTSSPTKHKDTSPAPIDAKDNAKVSPNNTTDQDESSSDFMYDFFIHRNNKFNSISSTNSTEIKSILKKKLDEDIYNASVISSNDSTSGSSSVVTSSGIVTGDSSKVGGTRKKKQVQFEAAATAEDEPLVATIQKSSKISFEDITAGEETCAEEDIVEDNATGDLDTCADGCLRNSAKSTRCPC